MGAISRAVSRELATASLLSLALAGCGAGYETGYDVEPRFDAGTPVALVELVETFPVDTDLDSPYLRETHEVWLEMIEGAERTIELEHFYASNAEGSRLEPIVRALEAAADRGVRIDFTADRGFYDREYQDTLDRLDARENIDVTLLDLRPITGGIQHAKCMLVDGDDLYVGSANFDWRALEHIQELGLRVQSEVAGGWVAEVLAYDRALASGAALEPGSAGGDRPAVPALMSEQDCVLSAAFSPRGALRDEATWDLPAILDMLRSARDSIRLQLLSYKPVDREGEWWDELDDALRGAAERGVDVRLVVADWSDKPGSIEPLAALAALEHCEVRFLRIPEHESGPIPFARVVHAKYLVVDGQESWVGTSNWQRGYFTKSRNLGFLLSGSGPASQLTRFFDRNWASRYADPVRAK